MWTVKSVNSTQQRYAKAHAKVAKRASSTESSLALARMAVFLKLGCTKQSPVSPGYEDDTWCGFLYVTCFFGSSWTSNIAKTKIVWAQRHKDLLALVKRVANPWCVGGGFEIIWDNYPFQALGPSGPKWGGPFAAHCLSELFTVAPQLGPRKLPDQWCKVGAKNLETLETTHLKMAIKKIKKAMAVACGGMSWHLITAQKGRPISRFPMRLTLPCLGHRVRITVHLVKHLKADPVSVSVHNMAKWRRKGVDKKGKQRTASARWNLWNLSHEHVNVWLRTMSTDVNSIVLMNRLVLWNWRTDQGPDSLKAWFWGNDSTWFGATPATLSTLGISWGPITTFYHFLFKHRPFGQESNSGDSRCKSIFSCIMHSYTSIHKYS